MEIYFHVEWNISIDRVFSLETCRYCTSFQDSRRIFRSIDKRGLHRHEKFDCITKFVDPVTYHLRVKYVGILTFFFFIPRGMMDFLPPTHNSPS